VAEAARPDTLLSFGGGSPIDAAKAVAFVLATGLDITAPDASARARALASGERALPHLAIPTTLSVAELSSSAGCSTEGNREEVGLRAPPPARGPRCLSQSASAWSRPR
jgi:alcohol dehydrogenase class IV